MRLSALLLFAAAALPADGAAQPPQTAPAADPRSCSVTGISTDTDPAGLRVHRRPDLGSDVLGVLLPGMDPEAFFHDEGATLADGLVGARFTVDAIEGDWLHISDIDPVTDGINPDGSLEGRPNFHGTGWVHASMVELLPIGGGDGHARPDRSSPVTSPNMNVFGARLVRCRGDWAELRGPSGSAWVFSRSNKEHAAAMRAALQSLANAK